MVVDPGEVCDTAKDGYCVGCVVNCVQGSFNKVYKCVDCKKYEIQDWACNENCGATDHECLSLKPGMKCGFPLRVGTCSNDCECRVFSPMLSSPPKVLESTNITIQNCEYAILITKIKYDNQPQQISVKVMKGYNVTYTTPFLVDEGDILLHSICLKPTVSSEKTSFPILPAG
ncbi:hypothetical protein A3K63_04000 [Candidatus Micrarchaeota archaeon RBG_16_49_10]|nr:MAG: hypothetical protein A3K63_04000 [Candidatus Micrarchaeota archaeon RBG_16_49_10]